MQNTVGADIHIQGVGLHSGRDVSLVLRPAPANSGIMFVRVDVTDKDNIIPALWNRVTDTKLCTVIANEDGVSVGTIEHLMAALRGCGIDNAVIELDGPEVPIMDGSAMPFVTKIEEAGIYTQNMPRRAIKILKEITVAVDGKTATLKPGDGSVFGGEIDFDHPQIGVQAYEMKLVNGNFKHDLADARTFGFAHEVEYMRKNGLALGGSLDNAIVLDKTKVMNPDGLRHTDEFIRHKLLDAIGDLYLAGAPILGTYESSKAGHALNNALLHKLFATQGAWEMIELYTGEMPVAAGFTGAKKASALIQA